MVVSLFLTHLLLEVPSPITFPPSPFRCHWSSRSKGLHWWRRSKAYKLYMELHHVVSRASSSRWCSFASSILLFGQFTLIPSSTSFRFYNFSVIIFLFWTFRFQFSSKIFIRKENKKSKCKSLHLCCLSAMFSHNNCHIMFKVCVQF